MYGTHLGDRRSPGLESPAPRGDHSALRLVPVVNSGAGGERSQRYDAGILPAAGDLAAFVWKLVVSSGRAGLLRACQIHCANVSTGLFDAADPREPGSVR